ncbi:hypothetical protein [Halovenus marina]|uniref:hypothetical protein n=1 Tax=Halovenus marina TaxID=3396621 RepID=UPI003F56F938
MSTDDAEGHPQKGAKHDLALVHLESSNGGHWWNYFENAEPPTYYHELDYNSRDDIPDEHLTHVPNDVEWSKYVHYNCRNPRCNDPCLNRADGPYAQTKLCRSCYPEADLDDLRPLSKHLPEWAQDLDLDHRQTATEDETTTSEGTPEEDRPTATPTPACEGDPASSGTTASEDHRERPPAMGVRPRTEAHPPNPEGEGESSADAVRGDEHLSETSD